MEAIEVKAVERGGTVIEFQRWEAVESRREVLRCTVSTT